MGATGSHVRTRRCVGSCSHVSLPTPTCGRDRLARLGNTQVACHFILFHFVDHDFRWLARAVYVEKDRLIDAPVPIFHLHFIHKQHEVALIFRWIGPAQFDRNSKVS
jgi:hypothetical protein